MALNLLTPIFRIFPKSGIVSLVQLKIWTYLTLKISSNRRWSLKNSNIILMVVNSATNYLWTRLWLGRTFLNSHGYAVGKVPSPACQWHHNNETVQHFLLDCFLYTNERLLLFHQVNQSVTDFYTMSKSKKLEMLLFGFPDNEKLHINRDVAIAVQSFILKTKRFLIRQ